MIFTYEIFTEQVGLDKKNFFTSPQRSTRGHQFHIMKKKANKVCRINTYSNRVIDDWKSLPTKVIAAKTTDKFKEFIDEHWKEERFITPF